MTVIASGTTALVDGFFRLEDDGGRPVGSWALQTAGRLKARKRVNTDRGRRYFPGIFLIFIFQSPRRAII